MTGFVTVGMSESGRSVDIQSVKLLGRIRMSIFYRHSSAARRRANYLYIFSKRGGKGHRPSRPVYVLTTQHRHNCAVIQSCLPSERYLALINGRKNVHIKAQKQCCTRGPGRCGSTYLKLTLPSSLYLRSKIG